MYLLAVLIAAGILCLSRGVPLNPNPPYNPESFFTADHRIVGGVEAPEGYSPHMMALVVGADVASFTCGASLVGRRRALTAAHCIDPLVDRLGELLSSVRGVVGTSTWSDERVTHRFVGYENHPRWDRWLIKNDVGLLFLAEDLQLNDRVGLVALNYDWIGGDERIYVTGWGTTRLSGAVPTQLHLLYVDTLSPEKCQVLLGAAQAALGPSPAFDPEVEVCTKHQDGVGNGMCHGDSGSALIDQNNRQIGIVSWGFPCALGHPDFHGRVSGFKEFLEPLLGDPE